MASCVEINLNLIIYFGYLFHIERLFTKYVLFTNYLFIIYVTTNISTPES